jgi:hypothetical protein
MAIDSNELLEQTRAGIGRKRGDRLFLWGACAALLVVLVGFARTYYLKAFFGPPGLSVLVRCTGCS